MEDNKAWLEQVGVNFEIALANGDYVDCKELIGRVRDEGYEVEAKELERLLKEETIGTFIHESSEYDWK